MNPPAFKDHFSSHANVYHAGRPRYPTELFAWLATLIGPAPVVVDLGCGSGQATVGLADQFPTVLGLDPSAAQIAQAEIHPRTTYRVAPAEMTGLPNASIDLGLAAQAFHWFDHERFFTEWQRIAKPGAVFAAVSYGTCTIDPAVDRVVDVLYHDLLDGHWPPERRHVEDGYQHLPFPLQEFTAPRFELRETWSLPRFCAYLTSWSAVKSYQREHGDDPLRRIADDLTQAWGDPLAEVTVTWPLAIRVGRTLLP